MTAIISMAVQVPGPHTLGLDCDVWSYEARAVSDIAIDGHCLLTSQPFEAGQGRSSS